MPVGSICNKCTSSVPLATAACGVCGSWRCRLCGVFSLATATLCESCEELRDPVESTPRPTRSRDPPAAVKPKACPRCTYMNRSEASHCAMCESLLPHVDVVPPSDATPSRRSTVLAEGQLDDFRARIEQAIMMCRQANTPFVAHMDAAESRLFEWGSIFTSLRPGTGAALRGGGIVDNIARLFGHNRSQQGGACDWCVFPAHGIRADDIVQGELGNCWFLSAVAVIAHTRPDLIERLFLVREVNPEGVFAVQLWCDGEWNAFLVDGTFPTCRQGTVFRFASCRNNSALWVPLLEKAYAFMHGSYSAIVAGNCQEAFYDLTGMPCEKIMLTSLGETAMAEAFVQMVSWASCHCTMGASCGGTPERDAEAIKLGLETQHCFSILDVTVCRISKRRLVRLRNPWGRSAYQGEAPPSACQETPVVSGSFWMHFELFTQVFSDVTICYTRPYCVGLSAAGVLCDPQHGFVPGPASDGGSLALCVTSPTVIRVMGVQPKLRGATVRHEGFFDVCLFLLRLSESGGVPPCVVAAGTSQCDRVVTLEHLVEPGIYAVIPFSLQQHSSTLRHHLVVSLLAETLHVAQLPWTETVPQCVPMHHVLSEFIDRDASHVTVSHASPKWKIQSWTRGTLRIELVRSLSSCPSHVTADFSESDGVVVQPAFVCTARLPPYGAAIVSASSVRRHTGQFSLAWSVKWHFMEEMGSIGACPPTRGGSGPTHPPILFRPFAP